MIRALIRFNLFVSSRLFTAFTAKAKIYVRIFAFISRSADTLFQSLQISDTLFRNVISEP